MKPVVEKSKLYEVIHKMPKGSIHHLHTSAAPPIEVYLKMTYDDKVYYNDRDGIFKVFPKPEQAEDGYIKCNVMRSFSKDPDAYDQKLKSTILLRRE
jgi:5,10-methenyltetrahydromethanopterin hydrogenase